MLHITNGFGLRDMGTWPPWCVPRVGTYLVPECWLQVVGHGLGGRVWGPGGLSGWVPQWWWQCCGRAGLQPGSEVVAGMSALHQGGWM